MICSPSQTASCHEINLTPRLRPPVSSRSPSAIRIKIQLCRRTQYRFSPLPDRNPLTSAGHGACRQRIDHGNIIARLCRWPPQTGRRLKLSAELRSAYVISKLSLQHLKIYGQLFNCLQGRHANCYSKTMRHNFTLQMLAKVARGLEAFNQNVC
jgi:hypothetical protein